MKRFILKTLYFLSPFIIWWVVEVFIIPVDAFTFRTYEALSSHHFAYPGPFYPNQHVEKKQEWGDHYRLDPSTRESKRVEWFTDGWGWRNRPTADGSDSYDIVLFGDSNMYGSFLDQKDMLSEVLERRGVGRVYSYAWGVDHVSLFFSDPRFKTNFPKTVICQTKPGYLAYTHYAFSNFEMNEDGTLRIRDRTAEFAEYEFNARHSRWLMWVDRMGRQLFRQYLKSTLCLVLEVKEMPASFWRPRPGVRLVQDQPGYPPRPDPLTPLGVPASLSMDEINYYTVQALKTLSEECRRRQADFIFLLLPDAPAISRAVVPLLRQQGVKVIAWLPSKEYPEGVDMDWFWNRADTHWREQAVRLTAAEIQRMMETGAVEERPFSSNLAKQYGRTSD